jgi:hypothetical protein
VNHCRGREQGNVYPFTLHTLVSSSTQQNYSTLSDDELAQALDDNPLALIAKAPVDLMHWHQRLGHLNASAIYQLAKGAATGIEIDGASEHNADCMACVEGKQHWLLFKSGCTHAMCVGELLHMDLAGPMEVTSFDNK